MDWVTIQVVNSLKSMQRCLVYGDQVTALLAASSAWSQQSDLVMEHKPVAGHLHITPQVNNNIYNGFILTITISPELTISKRQHGQPIYTSRSLQSSPAVMINMMINDGRRHLL